MFEEKLHYSSTFPHITLYLDPDKLCGGKMRNAGGNMCLIGHVLANTGLSTDEIPQSSTYPDCNAADFEEDLAFRIVNRLLGPLRASLAARLNDVLMGSFRPQFSDKEVWMRAYHETMYRVLRIYVVWASPKSAALQANEQLLEQIAVCKQEVADSHAEKQCQEDREHAKSSA